MNLKVKQEDVQVELTLEEQIQELADKVEKQKQKRLKLQRASCPYGCPWKTKYKYKKVSFKVNVVRALTVV